MKKNIEYLTKNKSLRKQDKRNELHRYCRLVKYAEEVGFFKEEAKEYARGIIGK